MNTIYLISNVHRSGSSMMMRCLTEAGMTGLFDTRIDNLIFQDDYHPNPNGFYQNYPNIEDRILDAVGCVTKFPWRNLRTLPVYENIKYKIIFLKRNPEDIRASMSAFSPFSSWGSDNVVLDFYDEVINPILDELEARTDVELTVLNYRDIVLNPNTEFAKLIEAGWPINVEIATSMVDSSLQRFKLENNG